MAAHRIDPIRIDLVDYARGAMICPNGRIAQGLALVVHSHQALQLATKRHARNCSRRYHATHEELLRRPAQCVSPLNGILFGPSRG
jgi:hypothetical protein